MAQRRKSETTLTPVHEGSSAYRYTKFAVLGSALTPRSKESLVVEAVSASVEVVHPADTSTAQTSIVRNRPATAGRPEGAKERSPESGVESGELPESSPNGAQVGWDGGLGGWVGWVGGASEYSLCAWHQE